MEEIGTESIKVGIVELDEMVRMTKEAGRHD